MAGFRALMGLAKAAAIPSDMKAAVEWFPDKERSVVVGWLNSDISLDAMSAPSLVVFLYLCYG